MLDSGKTAGTDPRGGNEVKSVVLKHIAVVVTAITISECHGVSHKDFGKLVGGSVVSAPASLRISGADGKKYLYSESRLAASDYLAQGWKRVIDEKPAPSATNRYVYATGWTETDDAITRQYAEADIPEPIKVPRKFSKLKIYGAIAQLGAWDKVQAWLESKEINGVNGWKAFTLAQEVNESNELFSSLAEEARKLLGLTEADFDALLNRCILEED